MNTLKATCLPIIAIAFLLPGRPTNAATIPANTTVLFRTTNNIYSRDPSGRKIEGVLANNIVAGGKVVVPAGTPLVGVVKSPKFTIGSTSRPLTLRLTQITLHGHAIQVKSDDRESNSPWATRRGVQVTGGAFMYTRATILPFRLNHPVEI
jgi:hypothetical protein